MWFLIIVIAILAYVFRAELKALWNKHVDKK